MALSLYLLLPLLLLCGALLNRHRGGWLGTGHTQVARLNFAIGLSLLQLLITWNWWSLCIIPLTFLGCLAGQGGDQAANTVGKVVGLFLSGLCNFAGVAVTHALITKGLDWRFTALVLILVALSKPLAYGLGKVMPTTLIPTLLSQGFARGDTEWGEVLFGSCEGAGLLVLA